MVSGVGFKNTADEEYGGVPRKHMVSPALIITFAVLVLVFATYGGLKLWLGSLQKQTVMLGEEIRSLDEQTQKALSGEVSDFLVRAHATDKELYRGYDTNDVLNEIEKIMIKKDSDGSGNRVVLKSFQHNSGAHEKKTVGDASVVTAGKGNITISADADTFDVMAQQIEEFKKSDLFSNVKVGTTDRDESGRIVFTLTMDVNEYDKSPFEKAHVSAPSAQVTVETQQQAVTVETKQQ